MASNHVSFELTTAGEEDIIDITSRVAETVAAMSIRDGILIVSVRSTTSAVIVNEDESGLHDDILAVFRELVPSTRAYRHDGKWGDGNGRSHVKAAIAGNCVMLPLAGAAPVLGTWQHIFLVEFDLRARTRTLDIVAVG